MQQQQDFHVAVQTLAQSLAGGGVRELINQQEDSDVIVEAFRSALFSVKNQNLLATLIDVCLEEAKLMEASKVPVETLFELLADAVDANTVVEIETQIWPIVEQRLTKLCNLVLSSGKQRLQLALLKVANELLKRMGNALICGKVLLWVANSLALGDRSGFNSNGTYFVNGRESMLSLDRPAPNHFSKLQTYMTTQYITAAAIAMFDFKDFAVCVDQVVHQFETVPVNPALVDNTAAAKSSQIRSYLDLNNAAVLEIQIKTNTFRCNILTQLVFFLRSVPGQQQNTEQIKTWERRCFALLAPHCKHEAIRVQLQRETVWEQWKKEKCIMEAPPLAAATTEAAAGGDVVIPVASRTPPPQPAFWAQIFRPKEPMTIERNEDQVSVWQQLRNARKRDLQELQSIVAEKLIPSSSSHEEGEEYVEEGHDAKRMRMD